MKVDSGLDRFMMELGYEKETAEKDHRPVTRYHRPDEKYANISIGLAKLIYRKVLETRIDDVKGFIASRDMVFAGDPMGMNQYIFEEMLKKLESDS